MTMVLGTLVALAYTLGLLDPLLARFGVAVHNRATLNDRKFAWRVLVDNQNALGGRAVLFGQPFGTGFDRVEPNGTVSTYAPHNWYVLLYLRIGLLGAAAVAMALARGLWRNIRMASPVDCMVCRSDHLLLCLQPSVVRRTFAHNRASADEHVGSYDHRVLGSWPWWWRIAPLWMVHWVEVGIHNQDICPEERALADRNMQRGAD